MFKNDLHYAQSFFDTCRNIKILSMHTDFHVYDAYSYLKETQNTAQLQEKWQSTRPIASSLERW